MRVPTLDPRAPEVTAEPWGSLVGQHLAPGPSWDIQP